MLPTELTRLALYERSLAIGPCRYDAVQSHSPVKLEAKFKEKHRLRSGIPSASACEGGPANLVVVRWTANQSVPGTKNISAEKIVMVGHQFHIDQ